MPDLLENLIKRKHLQDIRDTWQSRALARAQGQIGAVLLSVLAHNYDEHMLVLLHATFPGFRGLALPCLTTAARIVKNGAVVADVCNRFGVIEKKRVLYRDETALRDDFRHLADALDLSDHDRVEMFECVKRWVVADYRLDPHMNPQDPDAKRLVH